MIVADFARLNERERSLKIVFIKRQTFGDDGTLSVGISLFHIRYIRTMNV